MSAVGGFRGQVTLDGPSGTGKSSVARDVATRLGAAYLDTGAMYRAATVAVLDAGVDPEDAESVARVVSAVSAVPAVRRQLVDQQRTLVATAEAVVVEGRDIGTVVLPDATLKIYLTAEPEARAQRRADQLGITDSAEVAALAADLRRRDEYDSSREDSPLRPAADAVVVDSTHLEQHETVDRVVELACSAVGVGERA